MSCGKVVNKFNHGLMGGLAQKKMKKKIEMNTYLFEEKTLLMPKIGSTLDYVSKSRSRDG